MENPAQSFEETVKPVTEENWLELIQSYILNEDNVQMLPVLWDIYNDILIKNYDKAELTISIVIDNLRNKKNLCLDFYVNMLELYNSMLKKKQLITTVQYTYSLVSFNKFLCTIINKNANIPPVSKQVLNNIARTVSTNKKINKADVSVINLYAIKDDTMDFIEEYNKQFDNA